MKVDNKALTPGNNRMQTKEFDTSSGIIIQEFDEVGNHRLIHKETGETTEWAHYTQTCYMRGHVGYTAYYMDKEGVLPVETYVAATSVTVLKPKSYLSFSEPDLIAKLKKHIDECDGEDLMAIAETALGCEIVYSDDDDEYQVTPNENWVD